MPKNKNRLIHVNISPIWIDRMRNTSVPANFPASAPARSARPRRYKLITHIVDKTCQRGDPANYKSRIVAASRLDGIVPY